MGRSLFFVLGFKGAEEMSRDRLAIPVARDSRSDYWQSASHTPPVLCPAGARFAGRARLLLRATVGQTGSRK